MDATIFRNTKNEIEVYLRENGKTFSIDKCNDVNVSVAENESELTITIPVDSINIING